VQVQLCTVTLPSNDLRQVVHTHVFLSPSSSVVNKDSTFKAKAKDLDFKAKAKDLAFKAKAKDLTSQTSSRTAFDRGVFEC